MPDASRYETVALLTPVSGYPPVAAAASASGRRSRQALDVATLADPAAGTTVTPTRLTAGTTVNTVPAGAVLDVDVRVATAAEESRVDAGIRALRPTILGAALAVRGGPNRPPLAVSGRCWKGCWTADPIGPPPDALSISTKRTGRVARPGRGRGSTRRAGCTHGLPRGRAG